MIGMVPHDSKCSAAVFFPHLHLSRFQAVLSAIPDTDKYYPKITPHRMTTWTREVVHEP